VVIGGLVAEEGVVGSVLLYNTTSKVRPVEIITLNKPASLLCKLIKEGCFSL
jgi:hypothetical protein